jgi:hypothetical protein
VIHDDDINAFVAELRMRLAAGAKQYGNRSFERPSAEVINEIEQELLDVSGWSLVWWLRIQRARLAAECAARQGGSA